MRAAYQVLIVIKDRWYSDGETFATFPAARKHQSAVADRWNDCETAIGRGAEVLNFRESKQYRNADSVMRREAA